MGSFLIKRMKPLLVNEHSRSVVNNFNCNIKINTYNVDEYLTNFNRKPC